MKKIIVLFAVVLFVSGCAGTSTPTPVVPTPTPIVPTPIVTPKTQVYRNGTYNFEFTYPLEFIFTDQVYINFEDNIVQIYLPSSTYPNTNFGDAAFSVGSAYTKSLPECLKLGLDRAGATFDTNNSTVINGITFYKASISDAAAGNLYESRVFLTYNKSVCFEVMETIHYSNIGNYTLGTVKEIDKPAIWQRLDEVLNTFKFL